MAEYLVNMSETDAGAGQVGLVNWAELRAEICADRVSAPTTAGRLAELIIAAIQNTCLPPGSRLRETELAAALGASRTPLREALHSLKQQGILEHNTETGLRVRVLSWRDITELYELRAILEGLSAQLAARNASSAERDLIAQLNSKEQALMSAGAPPQDLAQLNNAFHQAILNAARNAFLQDCLRQQNQTLILLGPTAYSLPQRLEEISTEHQAICTAILSCNEAGAAQAMHDHLHKALAARLALLSEQISAKSD